MNQDDSQVGGKQATITSCHMGQLVLFKIRSCSMKNPHDAWIMHGRAFHLHPVTYPPLFPCLSHATLQRQSICRGAGYPLFMALFRGRTSSEVPGVLYKRLLIFWQKHHGLEDVARFTDSQHTFCATSHPQRDSCDFMCGLLEVLWGKIQSPPPSYRPLLIQLHWQNITKDGTRLVNSCLSRWPQLVFFQCI